jgi:hypothetical protein
MIVGQIVVSHRKNAGTPIVCYCVNVRRIGMVNNLDFFPEKIGFLQTGNRNLYKICLELKKMKLLKITGILLLALVQVYSIELTECGWKYK